jgi:peptidoglycan/xylan/chitin deacetylase (PgdA/CDA1 family)
MKKAISILLFCLILVACNFHKTSNNVDKSERKIQSWIRINNLGYLPNSIKVAVLGSKENLQVKEFTLHNAQTNTIVFTSDNIEAKEQYGPFQSSFRLNFSEFKIPGYYYIKANNTISPHFLIDPGVYDNTADFLLKYMRQQRCGFNPYLIDSCHLDDGYIVYPTEKTGQRIDVTGGWHDATDYLQYTATSANAIFQLLFSYRENPSAFGDAFQANGLPGLNGIPDIIDEAKFGMDWLLKMNPSPASYYNQIADDRDHAGFRLPNLDSVVYNPTYKGRPVYPVSGEPQGLFKYQNRSTGTASTAGKFTSAFAIGAEVLAEFYPDYAKQLVQRAKDAYAFGKSNPGASQTAPGRAPYFYEEDNWIDDMELGASSLYRITHTKKFKEDALKFAAEEKISPWIGVDSVNHYQYYPFLNAGHYELASNLPSAEKSEVSSFYDEGLELLYKRGRENPFFMGIPFIWCSNNYVTAAVSQCKLYRELTNDTKYEEMEASLRDWLLGCNPWGTSMIVGLPAHSDTPVHPHSSLNHLNGYQTDGGLIDGPVYSSIFNSLIGLVLHKEDSYKDFQSDEFVYHDDVGDYSTNEPTMDGTASLVYYFSSMENESAKTGYRKDINTYDKTGAIRRGSMNHKKLNLVFTGHEYGEGAAKILATLARHNIKASFFLTGDFYRNEKFKDFINEAYKNGHYLGAHSNQHLLYNDWSENKTLLVSEEVFKKDLLLNYKEMEKFGIQKEEALFFMPPYEWNDENITQWANQLKITTINYTPGTLSHTDYTSPDMDNYKSTQSIYNSIIELEAIKGLNGFMLLSHLGSGPKRTDKFFEKLNDLIVELHDKGYQFVSLNEVLSVKKNSN